MSNVLSVSVRSVSPERSFHGKRDGEEPEWPPAPLRLFQAIVDAAASKWRARQFDDYAKHALEWLEALPAPCVVTPSHSVGTPFRLSVPNNDLDSPAMDWARGAEPAKPHRPVDLRTMKTVRPIRTHAPSELDDVLHYLYALPDGVCPHEAVLKAAARSVTHLGWGVDMVAADAKVITRAAADKLPGHRWRPVTSGGTPLRIPKAGTLADLMRKHEEFLNRLSAAGFQPVPPLSCFEVKGYHSPTVSADVPADPRPLAAFEIHRTIDDQEKEENAGKSRFRPFHHARRVGAVAGMVRHATAEAARRLGHPKDWVDAVILGHGDQKDGQATSDDRLQFLPLPSLTPVGVSGIRRVVVLGPPGFDIARLRRVLNGSDLIDEDTKRPVAMLSHLASADKEVKKFIGPSTEWSTVTPVILPGHEDPDGLRRKYHKRVKEGGASAQEQKHLLDRLDARVQALLWKAFEQAGWTSDALAGAELEYRAVGWFRGLDMAKNYLLPPLGYPRYHVRVRFRQPVSGPLAVGAGRYRGMGLFAAEGTPSGGTGT